MLVKKRKKERKKMTMVSEIPEERLQEHHQVPKSEHQKIRKSLMAEMAF
jgi:hypothetical protein